MHYLCTTKCFGRTLWAVPEAEILGLRHGAIEHLKNMKKFVTLGASLLLLTACAQKSAQDSPAPTPTTLTWIEDKPEPTLQPLSLYPNVPDSLWKALGLEEGIPSSISCLLLQTDGKDILIDAGLGAPFSQLMPKLKELGISPETLSLIYISHLHPDHIGGLLKDGQRVFPNATLDGNGVEGEAWVAMTDDASRRAKSVRGAYRDHLHLFEAGDTLDGGIVTIEAYGHTPGHTVFQKDSILVVGDLVHGGALQLVHPEYNATYDMDAEAARQSRCRILDYARTHRLRIYGMHLPGPGPVVLE